MSDVVLYEVPDRERLRQRIAQRPNAVRFEDPVAPEVEARVEALLRRPYLMVVRGEPGDGYLAEAPELPGCFTAGETPEEAMELLRDAMRLWLIVAVEQGDDIPEPALKPVSPARAYSGRLVLRLPKSFHRRLAERAQAEGVSLNTLILTAAGVGLGLKVGADETPEPQPTGA